MKEGKSFTSSLIIRPEACCRKGEWQMPHPPFLYTTLFSSWSIDIPFKDDIGIIFFRGVSFMISTNNLLLSWQPHKHSCFIVNFYSFINVFIISKVPIWGRFQLLQGSVYRNNWSLIWTVFVKEIRRVIEWLREIKTAEQHFLDSM